MSAPLGCSSPSNPALAVPWGDIPDLTQRIRAPQGKPPTAQALVCRWLLEHGAHQAPILVAAIALIGRECELSRRAALQAIDRLAARGVVVVEKADSGRYARSIALALPDPPACEGGEDGQLSLLDLLATPPGARGPR